MTEQEQQGLFAEQYRRDQAPLAVRMRPRTIDDIVGQQHLVGPGAPLRNMIENDRLVSLILWGPAGTGKTTLAQVVAAHTRARFEQLSAVNSGIADVRRVIAEAASRIQEGSGRTVVFIDELHRFNKAQIDGLLPAVEDGTIVLIGATTENPFAEINGPLLSRCQLFRLEALSVDDIAQVLRRGAELLQVALSKDALEEIVQRSSGDARQALSLLEMVDSIKPPKAKKIGLDDVRRSGSVKIYEMNAESYYDEVAAWIQSMNGSHPQAAVYWLARLLKSGVDIKFLARRLMVLASEDIGLADPQAMVVAAACIQAVQFVGLPECALNLSEATLYMAQAPKSNRSAMAIWAAQEFVDSHPAYPVPPVMRSRENWWHDRTQAGEGYRYPHDEGGYAAGQQYLPDEALDFDVYRPSRQGFEGEVETRMAERREADTRQSRVGATSESGEHSGSPAAKAATPALLVGSVPMPDDPAEWERRLDAQLRKTIKDSDQRHEAVVEILAGDTDIREAAVAWASTGRMPGTPQIESHTPYSLAAEGYSPVLVFTILQQFRLNPQEAQRLMQDSA